MAYCDPGFENTNVSFDSSYPCMAGELILAVPGGPHTAGNAVGGTELVTPPPKIPRTSSDVSKGYNATLRDGISQETLGSLGETPQQPHAFWQDAQSQPHTVVPETPEASKVAPPRSGGQVPTPLGRAPSLSRKRNPPSVSVPEEKKEDGDEPMKFDKYYHQLLYTLFF